MATSPSTARAAANPIMHILKDAMVASVSSNGPDLSARQLTVFLKVYLEPGTEHTVRGLAGDLNVSKPAITRALDRLAEFDFTKRQVDPTDRRSVIAKTTPTGSAYLRTLSGYMADVSKRAEK
jgi:DNA-binding MarR family transcriptional regulator